MRQRTWATTAVTAIGLALATAAPATAGANAAAANVPWSASFQTASASGERWTEPRGTYGEDLVLSGTLSNTGSGCYSLWTTFRKDFTPGPVTKQAEICGAGTVEVHARQAYGTTTGGYLRICAGTENQNNCGTQQDITWWPLT